MNFWINTNKNTWHCFTKECPVFTKDGVKQIRELKANDYVVGKQGKLQKCISTFKRKYKGKVYKIGWNKLNQFEVTEGHPFLIVTKGSEKAPIWKPIEEINFHKERFVVPKKFGNLKEINLKEFIKVDYETKKLKIPKNIIFVIFFIKCI